MQISDRIPAIYYETYIPDTKIQVYNTKQKVAGKLIIEILTIKDFDYYFDLDYYKKLWLRVLPARRF